MPRLISPTLLVAALALTWSSVAQAGDSCTSAPCARQDVQVSPAEGGRAAIAIDPANPASLAVASRSPDCGSGFAVHLSKDDGATWRRNCTIWGMWDDETPMEVPTVVFNKQGELFAVQPLYWGSEGGSLRAIRSITDDTNWDGWYTLAESRYYHGWIFNPQAEADNSATSPYRNNLYVSFTDVGWYEGHKSRIRVARSTNNGEKWTSVNATPEATGNEQLDLGDLAIDRNGNLFVSYLSCPGRQNCRDQPAELRLVRSTDGGLSWSAPAVLGQMQLPGGKEAIDTFLSFSYGALPRTKAAVSYTPVIAVDASEGPHQNRLYTVTTTYADQQLQVQLTTSDDQGATWSTPRPVAIGPRAADQFMPWVSVSKQGVVAVTWLDQRKHPKQTAYQPMVAFSSDGGDTFSAPTALQGEASDPVALKDLRGSTSHAWAGKLLKTAFIGSDATGAPSLRLSTTKP